MSRQFVIMPANSFFRTDLSGMDIRVLGALGYHADRNGECFPSLDTMAELIGCHKATVSKKITRLESLGIIEVYRSVGGVNHYRVIYQFDEGGLPLGNGTEQGGLPLGGNGGLPPEGNGGVASKGNLTRTLNENKERNEREIEFEAWQGIYPRRVNRAAALKAFIATRKKHPLADLMRAARSAADKYRSTEQQYIPHPSTYLNQERWRDEETHDSAGSKPTCAAEIEDDDLIVMNGQFWSKKWGRIE